MLPWGDGFIQGFAGVASAEGGAPVRCRLFGVRAVDGAVVMGGGVPAAPGTVSGWVVGRGFGVGVFPLPAVAGRDDVLFFSAIVGVDRLVVGSL